MTATPVQQWSRDTLVALIAFYRRSLSWLKPPCCRFQPSCSEYGMEAIRRHGSRRGLALLFWRLLRCQPFYRGPVYDPVPATTVYEPTTASLATEPLGTPAQQTMPAEDER